MIAARFLLFYFFYFSPFAFVSLGWRFTYVPFGIHLKLVSGTNLGGSLSVLIVMSSAPQTFATLTAFCCLRTICLSLAYK